MIIVRYIVNRAPGPRRHAWWQCVDDKATESEHLLRSACRLPRPPSRWRPRWPRCRLISLHPQITSAISPPPPPPPSPRVYVFARLERLQLASGAEEQRRTVDHTHARTTQGARAGAGLWCPHAAARRDDEIARTCAVLSIVTRDNNTPASRLIDRPTAPTAATLQIGRPLHTTAEWLSSYRYVLELCH